MYKRQEELHAALVDDDYAPGEGAMSGDETEGEEDETESEVDEDYAISEVHSERAKMKKKTTTTQTQTEPPSSHTSRTPTQTTRKYSGPAKGSVEAKEKMERVRAAQWAKAGLVMQK